MPEFPRDASHLRRILWEMVSKAALRLRKMRFVKSLESAAMRRFFCAIIRMEIFQACYCGLSGHGPEQQQFFRKFLRETVHLRWEGNYLNCWGRQQVSWELGLYRLF